MRKIPNVIWKTLLYTGLMTVVACKQKATNTENSAGKYKVTQPFVTDTTYQTEYVAEIQSVQNIEIRSRVRGYIQQILVDEGSYVKEGQILFKLSSRIFQEELLKAKSQLKSAQAEYKYASVEIKNTQLLVDKGIVSKSELEMLKAKQEMIQAKIDEAKSAIALAELHISYTDVKAPFSGYINRIPNKKGSLVEEDALLTTLSDNREVYAYFHVAEADYLNLISSKKDLDNNRVNLMLANNTLYGHPGRVEVSESEFDKATGNIAFRARFTNPGNILKHGANGKIVITNTVKNALLIPQKSTFEIQDKLFVYVLDKNNQLQQRLIKPAMRITDYFILKSGINANEYILLEGAENLRNGDRIQPEIIKNSIAEGLATNK